MFERPLILSFGDEDLSRFGVGSVELSFSFDSLEDCCVVDVMFCRPSFSGVGVPLLCGDNLDSGDCVPGGGGGDSCRLVVV